MLRLKQTGYANLGGPRLVIIIRPILINNYLSAYCFSDKRNGVYWNRLMIFKSSAKDV